MLPRDSLRLAKNYMYLLRDLNSSFCCLVLLLLQFCFYNTQLIWSPGTPDIKSQLFSLRGHTTVAFLTLFRRGGGGGMTGTDFGRL